MMVHHNQGVWISDETYQRAADQAYAVFQMPGVQSWWNENKGRVFAPRVEDYLTKRVSAEAP
jgi:hypothetical protein